ncbi:phosphoribosylglycinamide formyltransferase [Pyruvatibacter sp. HU-CL02332]|uniref:phosphoribosylglycinamide formyltransferase n=1 Tax=Pyruvatibacter sp. HU-CL02332 TaxID=3127650 RepID=UPI003109C085
MKIAILISGRGSNMERLIEAASAPDYPAEIVKVISNRPDASGLQTAADAGIATQSIDHKSYATRADFDAALEAALNEADVDLVCHAGFMRILTDEFAARWEGRMVNIHPSLLPSFKGIRVQQQAIDAGATISGCTVHYIIPALDSGPIIAQAAVPVLTDDTAEALSARILSAEHVLYPAAVKLIASGSVKLIDGKVVRSLDAKRADTECPPLFSPQP